MVSKMEETQILDNLIFQLLEKERKKKKVLNNTAGPDGEFTRCLCNYGMFLMCSYFTL